MRLHEKRHDFIHYKIWWNRVVNLIRSSEKEFYQEAIQSNKINPSILWKHLKRVCPDEQPKALNSLNIDGEVITNESEIANALNSFYVLYIFIIETLYQCPL